MNFQEGEILYISKPYRLTSFAVVKKVRYLLCQKLGVKKIKVGHAGTLDPLATGVMIVCTGHATKRIEELQGGEKEYIATIKLGETTASFDLEHEVDATYPVDHITPSMVEEVLRQFTGVLQQVPPTFSACKVSGKPAYKLARKGRDVQLAAKEVTIYEIELLDCTLPLFTIRVRCSKGTYIRSLARDLGEALHSGAHLTALERTRVGEVTLSDCIPLDDFSGWLDKQTIEIDTDTK